MIVIITAVGYRIYLMCTPTIFKTTAQFTRVWIYTKQAATALRAVTAWPCHVTSQKTVIGTLIISNWKTVDREHASDMHASSSRPTDCGNSPDCVVRQRWQMIARTNCSAAASDASLSLRQCRCNQIAHCQRSLALRHLWRTSACCFVTNVP